MPPAIQGEPRCGSAHPSAEWPNSNARAAFTGFGHLRSAEQTAARLPVSSRGWSASGTPGPRARSDQPQCGCPMRRESACLMVLRIVVACLRSSPHRATALWWSGLRMWTGGIARASRRPRLFEENRAAVRCASAVHPWAASHRATMAARRSRVAAGQSARSVKTAESRAKCSGQQASVGIRETTAATISLAAAALASR
jgi:hypothetical protein